MDIRLAGGAWLTAGGWGCLGKGKRLMLSPGKPALPGLSGILDRPVSRSGRFDAFTQMGLAAAALALKDAGWLETPPADPIGMVVSSVLEVLETDFAYYRTTMAQSGLLSSPNLFSYTLPVAVLGECASNFGLTGPTFVLGDDGNAGWNALKETLSMMAAGEAAKMIAGWIDNPPRGRELQNEPEPLSGAVFAALDANPQADHPYFGKVVFSDNEISTEDGRRIDSLAGLLNSMLRTR